jgi:OOP family OmpA-OmpF porin
MNINKSWFFSVGIVLLLAACQPKQPETAAPVAATPASKPAPPPACPDVPTGTRVGPMGCPCEMTVQLQFKSDSAELTDEDKARLDKAAETLQRLHWISGTIEGYTDATGKVDYNQKLSEQRATTVRDYLLSKGVGDERMTVVGYGETKPIADNATEEGRVQNRRVVMRRRDCDEPK